MAAAVIAWCDERKQFRSPGRLRRIIAIDRTIMMLTINIAAGAIAERASHQDIRKEVIATSEARKAYRGRESVHAETNKWAVMTILRGDHSGQGPGVDRVA